VKSAARSSESNPLRPRIRSTTVLAVRRAGQVVIGGDGQVTMGNTVVKSTARKIRRLHDSKIVAGAVDSVEESHPDLVGGLGLYTSSRYRTSYVHIDTRGHRSRWRG